MTMSISSTIVQSYNSNVNQINSLNRQLASGKKDLNPAEEGIVLRLKSQVTGYEAAQKNINSGKSVIAVAASGLSNIASIIQKLQDISNQASVSNLSDSDRTNLNTTAQSLISQITDIANSSDVNGANLLSASATDLGVTVGVDSDNTVTVSKQSADAASLSIDALDISTKDGATAAVAALKTAMSQVSASQSALAASKTGLEARQNTIASIQNNLNTTISGIEDIDQAAVQQQLSQLNQAVNINLWQVQQLSQANQTLLKIFQ